MRKRRSNKEYRNNKLTLAAKLKNFCLDGMICHHIVPLSIGGGNEVRNLCYMGKGSERALHKSIGDRPTLSVGQLKKLAKRYGAIGVDIK